MDVDKDLIGRARDAVGKFFIFISHKIVAIVDLVTVKSREDFLKLKMKRLQLILSVNFGWMFNSKCESQWKEEDWAEFFRVMLPDSSPDL